MRSESVTVRPCAVDCVDLASNDRAAGFRVVDNGMSQLERPSGSIPADLDTQKPA
jgi:hypothetical protein